MSQLVFKRFIPAVMLYSAAAFGQYKAERAGPPPLEVAPAISQVLQKEGMRITNNGAPYCEIWFRTTAPGGGNSTEAGVTLTAVPQGALLGVIRFDGKGSDRLGQTIQAGVYTFRYSIFPMNDDHQGAAPQRDFGLLAPADDDKDLNAAPNFETLAAISRKVSGTQHPAVMSLWKADSGSPGFSQQGDSDWVLETKLGDTPIAIILIGTASF